MRAKVRRDVRQAVAWDEELCALDGDLQEMRLLELARFEHLTATEQSIYVSNGGMAEEEKPPAPCHRATKWAAGLVMLVLLIVPMLYLLLFGLAQGKKMTKTWWTSTMTTFVLTFLIYEPAKIGIVFVAIPMTIRRKLKRLVDPTQLTRFPFKTPLHEHPTTCVAYRACGIFLVVRSACNVTLIPMDSQRNRSVPRATAGISRISTAASSSRAASYGAARSPSPTPRLTPKTRTAVAAAWGWSSATAPHTQARARSCSWSCWACYCCCTRMDRCCSSIICSAAPRCS